jgi:hypothetical protein
MLSAPVAFGGSIIAWFIVWIITGVTTRNIPTIVLTTSSSGNQGKDVAASKAISTLIEWRSRVVSNIHAAVATLLGIYCFIWSDDAILAMNDPMASTFGVVWSRDISLSITCGYLAYDLLLCMYYGSISPGMVDRLTFIHHALIIMAFGLGVIWHIGTFYMTAFMINEASTFFVNGNFFLAANPATYGGKLYKV